MCEVHYFAEDRIFFHVKIACEYPFYMTINWLIMYLVLCRWNVKYMTISMLI